MPKRKVRADGRIPQRVTLPDGTKKDVYGRTPTELRNKVTAVVEAAKQGVKLRDRTTVEGWAKQWLIIYKGKRRYNTKKMYASILSEHVIPAIGGMPLKKVCQADIQQILNNAQEWEIKNKAGEVVKSGKASKSLLKKIMLTLTQLFETAAENHLIAAASNPCNGVKVERVPKLQKLKILSREQQEQIMRASEGRRGHLFVALGNYAGLRREESCALMWRDIDWKNRSIKIQRSVEFHNGRAEIVPLTKSDAGIRSIPILDPLWGILNAANPQHIEQGAITVLMSRKGGEAPVQITSIFVCPSYQGDVMSLSSYDRMWESIEKRVDFHVTSHMLRHTYCTALYNAGIDLRMAQYLMGHADIKMTAEIYTHIEKHQIEAASLKIKNIFDSQSNSQSEAG